MGVVLVPTGVQWLEPREALSMTCTSSRGPRLGGHLPDTGGPAYFEPDTLLARSLQDLVYGLAELKMWCAVQQLHAYRPCPRGRVRVVRRVCTRPECAAASTHRQADRCEASAMLTTTAVSTAEERVDVGAAVSGCVSRRAGGGQPRSHGSWYYTHRTLYPFGTGTDAVLCVPSWPARSAALAPLEGTQAPPGGVCVAFFSATGVQNKP